jgi:galactokinase
MDLEVSCDELNVAVDTAFRVGALGARMVGAGGGGSAVALVRRSQAAAAAKLIDSEFQANGLARPSFAFF